LKHGSKAVFYILLGKRWHVECEKEVAEACHDYDMMQSIKENGTSRAVHRSAHRSYSKTGGPFG